MSVFSDDRAAIAAALPADLGWSIHDHLPGRAVPPCYVVMHASPFVTRDEDNTFGEYTAHYEVWACPRPAANEVEIASAEDGAEAAADALAGAGFVVESIDQPVSFKLNGTDYFAICINVSTGLRFGNT